MKLDDAPQPPPFVTARACRTQAGASAGRAAARRTVTGLRRSRLLGIAFVVALAACSGESGAPFGSFPGLDAQAAIVGDDDAGPHDSATIDAPPPADALRITPLVLQVANVPVPVQGSDGRYHVVYEMQLVNAGAEHVKVARLEVLDARSRAVVASLDAAQVAGRLVVRDAAAQPGTLGASQAGMLYLHLVFDSRAALPGGLDHRIGGVVDSQPDTFTAARTRVANPSDLVLDAPLRGPRYIAGDGCCTNTRHMRSTLALNGAWYTAQRFAIDWEQLDGQGRIYVGDPKDPASYVIYGQPAYAVADARVVTAVDGMPDSPPGAFPQGITVDQADGNHVVLDLGDGRYALYAHFKPGSVRVRAGQQVRRGDVLGLVGTSGNSSEPHLHFHVMDGPSPLASNGLPYRLRQYTAAYRGISTAAFDQAIVDGQPIAVEPVADPGPRRRLLPLDLWIVDLPEQP